MCKYTFHQSSTCHKHHDHHPHKAKDTPKNQPCQWIQIAQPCFWGAGLITCPIFASNALRIEGPNVVRVVRNGCPRHNYKGFYDMNLVKMVEESRTGGSWFGPPDRMPEPRKRELKKEVERDDIKLCVIM
ncbi:hypothetical protein NHQ30_009009 [Ciborinia camelliae]|nr:hypothetical protein NHQ30_009009 [Ciborinia camelliae]